MLEISREQEEIKEYLWSKFPTFCFYSIVMAIIRVLALAIIWLLIGVSRGFAKAHLLYLLVVAIPYFVLEWADVALGIQSVRRTLAYSRRFW